MTIQCARRRGMTCTLPCALELGDEESPGVCAQEDFEAKFPVLNTLTNREEIQRILLDGIPAAALEDATLYLELLLGDGPKPRPRFGWACKIEDAKAVLEHLGHPNFTYDRSTKMVFIEFTGGAHDGSNVTFYWLAKLRAGEVAPDDPKLFRPGEQKMFVLSDVAERYVLEGKGFFSSSVYKGMGMPRRRGFPITHAKAHKLTAQEKRVFDAYGFDPI